MNIKDYETKVPEEIRISNKEKLDQYQSELKVLEDALSNMRKIK